MVPDLYGFFVTKRVSDLIILSVDLQLNFVGVYNTTQTNDDVIDRCVPRNKLPGYRGLAHSCWSQVWSGPGLAG